MLLLNHIAPLSKFILRLSLDYHFEYVNLIFGELR